MKLTFPPKKIQFWLAFSGLSISIASLIWFLRVTISNFGGMENASGFTLIVGRIIGIPFTLAGQLLPLPDDYTIQMIIFPSIIFYPLMFWTLGSIFWMIISAIKKNGTNQITHKPENK